MALLYKLTRTLLQKRKKISAKIQVSISDLDYATAVKVSGYDIPGLLNRTASSTVTVDDGGTIVIAGLKQAKKENTFQRVPLLSSIPDNRAGFLNLIAIQIPIHQW